MTIDELFNMPIFQMKKWLSDNYKDPIGSYKNGSYGDTVITSTKTSDLKISLSKNSK